MLKARSTCTTSPSVQLSMYHLVTSSFSSSCTVKLLIIIIIIELTFLMSGVQITQQPVSEWRGKAKEKRESLTCEPQNRSSCVPFAVWQVRFHVCYYMTLYTFPAQHMQYVMRVCDYVHKARVHTVHRLKLFNRMAAWQHASKL